MEVPSICLPYAGCWIQVNFLPFLVLGEGVHNPHFETFIGDVALGIEGTSAQVTVRTGELAFVLEPDSPTLGGFHLYGQMIVTWE